MRCTAFVRRADQLMPLANWETEGGAAVKFAARQAYKVGVGPSQRMFELVGRAIPVCVMTGNRGLLPTLQVAVNSNMRILDNPREADNHDPSFFERGRS